MSNTIPAMLAAIQVPAVFISLLDFLRILMMIYGVRMISIGGRSISRGQIINGIMNIFIGVMVCMAVRVTPSFAGWLVMTISIPMIPDDSSQRIQDGSGMTSRPPPPPQS